ncbi:c-type cytochrome [Sphingobium lignivorans]|uniref:Mono/diheme cytochrome c family protein n=1 Tax=Sphingobium lignivorans TaxID=2735886 RepID=A0ABR6NBK1_9SPHN|nr:mono/diheme cytochrome c family protein [Sphingobium lignivorans]
MVSQKARIAGRIGAATLVATLALAPLGQLLAQHEGHGGHQQAAPAGNAEKGKAVFENAACGACHVLAAAEATGEIGPSLDGNANLTHAFVLSRVRDGQGAMPPYAGQLSDEDIENVTAYVLSAAAKK